MQGEELVGFLHCDLSGLNRGRSVPASELESRLEAGVGWVPADQALTPFGPIAELNPWGSMGDLRLLPDRATEARVDLPEVWPLHFCLCDAANTDGSAWDSCPRTFLKDTLTRLERESGLRLVASFEHELMLRGPTLETGPGFSFEAGGTLRALDPNDRVPLREMAREILENTARAHGCVAKVEVTEGEPGGGARALQRERGSGGGAQGRAPDPAFRRGG